MEILLIMIYVALCFAIFKLFRIPVNASGPCRPRPLAA